MSERTLSKTTGLCPNCLGEVTGEYEEKDGSVHLTRSCPEHGETTRKVWDSVDHWEWASKYSPDLEFDDHLSVEGDHSCLAVVEVTRDCNLSCSYCFASSGPGGDRLSFDEVTHLIDVVREEGGTRPIQLSGGEPTVRDDLPKVVEYATEEGFNHVQVNTNGLRIAREDGYAERLEEAGITAVYLQFDGTTSETYEEVREADILEEKHEAVEACHEAGLPVVLVPTVVPGVNDDEMGDVVRFAFENLDVVESVNFQPVAHFGRYEKNDGRFSLDEAAGALAEQLGMEKRDVMPIPCCSSYCQMATVLAPAPSEDGFVPLTTLIGDTVYENLAEMIDESDWMGLMTRTSEDIGAENACSSSGCCEGVGAVPDGVKGIFDDVLSVSITGFMDADAGDADRLANCCISVPTPDGELVPFCGYNMTTDDGRYEMRNRNDWGGVREAGTPSPDENTGMGIDEPPTRPDGAPTEGDD